jgi:hypothetical protein
MPSLAQSIQAARDLPRDQFQEVQPAPATANPTPPLSDNFAMMNQFLRCPLPPIHSNPDSLRQFYRGGVPQYRLIPL